MYFSVNSYNYLMGNNAIWRETNVSPIWLAVAGLMGLVRRKCIYAHPR